MAERGRRRVDLLRAAVLTTLDTVRQTDETTVTRKDNCNMKGLAKWSSDHLTTTLPLESR
jgi:hypothetical protein